MVRQAHHERHLALSIFMIRGVQPLVRVLAVKLPLPFSPIGDLSLGPLSEVFFLDLRVEQANRPFSLNHPDHLLTGTRWQLSEGQGRGMGRVVGNDKAIKL